MVSGRRDYWAGYYTPDEMTVLASDVQGQFGEDYKPLEDIPYTADGRLTYPDALLVDGYTASASEIFASALQVYGLSDGGGLKLTTATWTTGLGRAIDGVGLSPTRSSSTREPRPPLRPR